MRGLSGSLLEDADEVVAAEAALVGKFLQAQVCGEIRVHAIKDTPHGAGRQRIRTSPCDRPKQPPKAKQAMDERACEMVNVEPA